jgi:hypothetical protein
MIPGDEGKRKREKAVKFKNIFLTEEYFLKHSVMKM